MNIPSELVSSEQLHEYGEFAEVAARAGGDVLRDWRGRFAVSAKGPRDLVTEADLAPQKTIREILLSKFPNHGFIGEESEIRIGRHNSPIRSNRRVSSSYQRIQFRKKA